MTMGDRGAVRRHPARLAAAVLCLVAAVTAFTGSFLPLFSVTQSFGAQFRGTPDAIEIVVTTWGTEVTGGMVLMDVPANGLPIVFSAIVLACAALVCRRAARPGATPGTQRLAGAATVFGGAFLACAAWMVTLQVNAWVSAYEPDEVAPEFRLDVETSYLAGLWVLVAAAVLGMVAVVPSLVSVPAPPPAPPVDPDAPTPPFGLALPVPEEPPVQMVDPLTGEPVSEPMSEDREPSLPRLGPIVIPDAPSTPERPAGPAVPLTDDPLADPRHD